jgi:hypothetical protein
MCLYYNNIRTFRKPRVVYKLLNLKYNYYDNGYQLVSPIAMYYYQLGETYNSTASDLIYGIPKFRNKILKYRVREISEGVFHYYKSRFAAKLNKKYYTGNSDMPLVLVKCYAEGSILSLECNKFGYLLRLLLQHLYNFWHLNKLENRVTLTDADIFYGACTELTPIKIIKLYRGNYTKHSLPYAKSMAKSFIKKVNKEVKYGKG